MRSSGPCIVVECFLGTPEREQHIAHLVADGRERPCPLGIARIGGCQPFKDGNGAAQVIERRLKLAALRECLAEPTIAQTEIELPVGIARIGVSNFFPDDGASGRSWIGFARPLGVEMNIANPISA